jgi:hypothetical protein
MRVAQLIVSASLLMVSGATVAARDYFSRGWSEHDYDFEIRYRKNVQRILGRAFQHDVLLRTVHLPPFDPEWIVGVMRVDNGYRAFRKRLLSSGVRRTVRINKSWRRSKVFTGIGPLPMPQHCDSQPCGATSSPTRGTTGKKI